MAETVDKKEEKRMPPGFTVPWEEALGSEQVMGNVEIIKKEWEKLDTFAYLYLWYWVHR